MNFPFKTPVAGLGMAIVLLLSLSACVPGAGDIAKTLELTIRPEHHETTAKLSPNFDYLRLTRNGNTVFLVRGSVEFNPQGRIDIWYSAKGEILRTQNGRIIASTGLHRNWSHLVYSPAPAWQEVLSNTGTAYRLSRTYDEMPGYKFGITESVTLRHTAPPDRHHLLGVPTADLAWIAEISDAGATWRFALSRRSQTVVYSEQCFGPDDCFAWQNWPPEHSTTPVGSP